MTNILLVKAVKFSGRLHTFTTPSSYLERCFFVCTACLMYDAICVKIEQSKNCRTIIGALLKPLPCGHIRSNYQSLELVKSNLQSTKPYSN